MTRACLIAALAVALASPAFAQQRPEHSKVTCNCKCDAGNGVSADASYDAIALCAGYDGKTCNFQGSDGTIKTGSLKQCTQGNRWTTSMGAAVSSGLTAQPRPPRTRPQSAPPATGSVSRSD